MIDSWFRFLGPDLGGVLGDEEAWVAATLPPSSGPCLFLLVFSFGIFFWCILVFVADWYVHMQVVAIAVFLALGFAFYVFFVPFVGRSELQYVLMGLYTPLVSS